MMAKLSNNWLKAARVLVLITLFVLLWRSFDGASALILMRDAELGWLILAAMVLAVQTLVSAARWRLTAGKVGVEIGVGFAVREYFLGQVINLSLPGGVVGDGGRAYRSRQSRGFLVAGQAVIFERVAGQLGLIFVFLCGLGLSLLSSANEFWPAWLESTIVWLLTALVATPLVLAAGLHLFGKQTRALRRLLGRFARAIFAKDVVLKQVSLSISTATLNVSAFALCGVALGISMPIWGVATLLPLTLLAMLVPISVSGWGVREGAAAILLPVLGATSSEGLAASVLFGLCFLASTVTGFIVCYALKYRAIGGGSVREPERIEPQPAVSDA